MESRGKNQATDRAYRIGQTRDVLVHKFLCVGTLEEKIDEMIERKKEVAEQVVGTGEGWLIPGCDQTAILGSRRRKHAPAQARRLCYLSDGYMV